MSQNGPHAELNRRLACWTSWNKQAGRLFNKKARHPATAANPIYGTVAR
jgi:hypothetical protein